MPKPGEPPRRAALSALVTTIDAQQMLALPEGLAPEDAARANRLALTVLRHMGRLDQVLGRYVQRKPELDVHMLLRLGAAELLVDGAAAHGVVDGYVSLTKARKGSARAGGMINAVLRRVAREGPEIWAGLAAQKLPGWLRKPLTAAYGKAAVLAIEAAHEAGAPIDLTLRNPGRDPAHDPGATEIPGAQVLPTGSLRLPSGSQVSAVPGYDTGAFWVQDAAAALPVRLLGDVAGKAVLDLCAAPGGKTMQLAAAGAQVTALDDSPARMERLRENLTRTGLKANLVEADATAWRGGPFDAILLDAPCSATGTIRRHPELPFIRGPKDVAALTRLQARMIDAAASLLKPGGRLVYCTCSLLPEEGEAQIKAALARHEDLSAAPADPVALGGDAAWQAAHGALRLRPDFMGDLGGMDGFYMAALDRR